MSKESKVVSEFEYKGFLVLIKARYTNHWWELFTFDLDRIAVGAKSDDGIILSLKIINQNAEDERDNLLYVDRVSTFAGKYSYKKKWYKRKTLLPLEVCYEKDLEEMKRSSMESIDDYLKMIDLTQSLPVSSDIPV